MLRGNRGHWNGLTCCKCGCHLASRPDMTRFQHCWTPEMHQIKKTKKKTNVHVQQQSPSPPYWCKTLWMKPSDLCGTWIYA